MTQVQTVTVFILRMMSMAPMMCIGGLIMAILVDRPLTLVLAVAVPILVLAILLIARGAIPLFRLMQVKLDTLNRVLREALTGIRVVRAFNRTAYESRRFDRGQRGPDGQRHPGEPDRGLADAPDDAGDEPDHDRHRLVRGDPDR